MSVVLFVHPEDIKAVKFTKTFYLLYLLRSNPTMSEHHIGDHIYCPQTRTYPHVSSCFIQTPGHTIPDNPSSALCSVIMLRSVCLSRRNGLDEAHSEEVSWSHTIIVLEKTGINSTGMKLVCWSQS